MTAQAALAESGHWPGGQVGGRPRSRRPCPTTAVPLLHVPHRRRAAVAGPDNETHLIRFTVTGLYRPRQVSSPYWGLNDVALSGSTTLSGFTTYGPLTVSAAAFSGPLAVEGGSWVAVPRTADIPAGQLRAVAANVSGLWEALAECRGPAGPHHDHRPARGGQPGSRTTGTWPARYWPSAPCCSSCSPPRPCSRWRGCLPGSGKASRRC